MKGIFTLKLQAHNGESIYFNFCNKNYKINLWR